jgi:beta-xylosidase
MRIACLALGIVAAMLLLVGAHGSAMGSATQAIVDWRIDNLQRIGGHVVTVVGDPSVVSTDRGAAVAFDGVDDGLLIDNNPLAGLERFTVEAVIRPAAGGGEEQRFLHFEEDRTGNRALIELRMDPAGRWALDTFLRSPEPGLTLLDRARTHEPGEWHTVSLSYDGRQMSHRVNGVVELEGTVAFAALRNGRTSIGMRQNHASFFKGQIASIRITSDQVSNEISWARGIEGQRKADLADGRYLNPIMPGDHPDPSVLKDGTDYYMTFSSFDAYPGLVIWHSRDLVNWQPIGPALFKNVGSVWAPDLVKHQGRYYIYFPGVGSYRSNYVIWADDIRGPWSDPIDLKIGRIDPGHAVGPDGRRYLFLSAGFLVSLTDDGLAVVGEPRKVYDGWKYPSDWIVEAFAQEGPKLLKRGDYYYMVLAQGGTAGPPTGHMIVAARSRSIEGPWENSPHNPIVRTTSAAERWWSKGHGTLVEDAAGTWWIVYHAYENGFQTLGRQTLLEPIEWMADGWFRAGVFDPARPIPKPTGATVPHGLPYSDDFSTNRLGVHWSFYNGTAEDRSRIRYADNSLILTARGTGPADSSPLWFVTGDHAYEIDLEIDADPDATAGLLLFYSRRLYAGLGFSATNFIMHSYGLDRPQAKPASLAQRLHLRIRNDRHIVTMFYSVDGRSWERYDRGMEVSGYHHNVAYDFLSLRPAIYAAGSGEVRFRNLNYRALP